MTVILPREVECAGCGHHFEAFALVSYNTFTPLPDLRSAECPRCGREAEDGIVFFADEERPRAAT